LSNQLNRANKLGAAWVLIIGENEVKSGRFQLKNMETGQQKESSREEILKILKDSA
jgi:histidyl-tRNA synthetase